MVNRLQDTRQLRFHLKRCFVDELTNNTLNQTELVENQLIILQFKNHL